MGRPDWRAMLAGMTSTEYADWRHFYCTHYSQDTQLDIIFPADVRRTQPVFCDPDMHPGFQSACRGRTGEDAGRK
ncbi:phage tail assembly protein T [Escherichia coli]|uniref:phage tail assembly protein T n=1 Tax=Escherichia coli TaxID=562 RepID=UPI00397EA407